MSKVSVIIPTYNRPEQLKNAVQSVLDQSYKDFEVIVVDDGDRPSKHVLDTLHDDRINYIVHVPPKKGGGAARNTGIQEARGEYIALLDDDDVWLPKKLEIQMKAFESTESDVGFSFTAVESEYDDRNEITRVPDGVNDYLVLLTKHFSGFLNVTLIIKKKVIEDIGMFDETFPSHQETDLLMRIMKKYKGLGINMPLTKVNMHEGHSTKNYEKIIRGRLMILDKYFDIFSKDKKNLAHHYFRLALLYRDDKQYVLARKNFSKAYKTNFRWRYLFHYLSLLFNALPYKLIK